MTMANIQTNSFIHNTGLNEENSMPHLIDAISPDSENESTLIEHSKYYGDTEFEHALQQCNSKISMLSINCQSINAKFDKLKLFLDDVNTKNKISVICVQETWNHEGMDTNCFSLPDYTLINANRRLTAHGGLMIYLHDDFSYKEININATNESNLFESLLVEIWRKDCSYQKFVVGNIYRLPSYLSADLRSFTNEFTNLLNILRTRSKFVYICGDYNIDLLKIQTNDEFSIFYTNIVAAGFAPKITLPTRICDTTSTLIDNVYSNVIDKSHTSGILVRPISDHQMYFCIMNDIFLNIKTAQKYIKIEVSNQNNIDKFVREVSDADIYSKLEPNLNTDPNHNYEILAKHLQLAKSKHIPQKTKKFNKRKHFKEKWMTQELLAQVVKKNSLYVKWKTTPVTHVSYDTVKQRFKSCEKDILKQIQMAKSNYFNRIFTAYRTDMKKTWRTINETLSRNKKKCDLPPSFEHNGRTLSNSKEIANTFNLYFANIGANLASEIETQLDNTIDFSQYMGGPANTRLQFKCITETETLKAIDNLENKNSSGHDGISNKLLKLTKKELSKSLTLIINQMITTGIFPDSFKKSKITPLFKKGDQSLLLNYRPISLLPTISKVFEKILFDQMYTYFNTNSLLAEQQYGFRKNHSTEYAAIKLVDHVSKEMESGKIPCALYIDLSKAFDTLSFDIIIGKLRHYGVADVELRLLISYLTNRKQYVVYNNHESDITEIKAGVPQGSILGPLFFSILINDLINISSKLRFLMYADDTTIYFNLENFTQQNLNKEINCEIKKINTWLKINRLSLNLQKTKLMIFHRKQKHIQNINIVINGMQIERVESFNFLGITLTEIGYEPAGLTVHPPPRMIEGGFIFFVWVSSVTKIFSSKKKWIL